MQGWFSIHPCHRRSILESDEDGDGEDLEVSGDLLGPGRVHFYDFDAGDLLSDPAKIRLELAAWIARRRVEIDKDRAVMLKHFALEG